MKLHSKKTIEEFSDRELLLFILSNQVKIFRQVKYVEQQVKNGKTEALGPYSNTLNEMLSNADSILEQLEKYLNQTDADKGFLKL